MHVLINMGKKCPNIATLLSSPHMSQVPLNHRRARPPEMSTLVFSDMITTSLPLPTTHKLLQEYTSFNGRLPKRDRLRELASELGISQARIKKWFQDQDEQTLKSGVLADDFDELAELIEVTEDMLSRNEALLNSL